jgi:hypothetical protein
VQVHIFRAPSSAMPLSSGAVPWHRSSGDRLKSPAGQSMARGRRAPEVLPDGAENALASPFRDEVTMPSRPASFESPCLSLTRAMTDAGLAGVTTVSRFQSESEVPKSVPRTSEWRSGKSTFR